MSTQMIAAPASSTKQEHFFDDDRGKRRRLFRNSDNENWQFRIEHNGKDYPRSTRTTITKIAVKNAKFFIKSLLDKNWEDIAAVARRRREDPFATIGDLLDTYELAAADALRIKQRTVNGNAGALASILEMAKPDVEDVRVLPVSILEGDAVLRAFVKAARAAGRPDVSIKSQINQARSVVCREVLPIYEGFKLPSFGVGREVQSADGGTTVSIRPPFTVDISWKIDDVGFERIPDKTIKEMEKSAAELLKFARGRKGTAEERAEALAQWLVYMMMARLGMRNSEVVAARWGWIEERYDRERKANKQVMVIQDRRGEGYTVKNGLAGSVDVPAELYAEFKKIRKDAKDDAFIVPAATPTDRHKVCYRKINDFVRPFLPGREKCSYELRKWAGSLKALHKGIYAAQQFLRHRSVKTTETYYRAFLVEAMGISDEDVRNFHGLDVSGSV